MDSIRATALVDGRVQGVGFRAWVGRVATPLGLTGHAKNLADGRVEVVAEGERSGVEKLLALLDEQPSGAGRPGRVTAVAAEYGQARGESGFRRL